MLHFLAKFFLYRFENLLIYELTKTTLVNI